MKFQKKMKIQSFWLKIQVLNSKIGKKYKKKGNFHDSCFKF